jgi:hypothetical protein
MLASRARAERGMAAPDFRGGVCGFAPRTECFRQSVAHPDDQIVRHLADFIAASNFAQEDPKGLSPTSSYATDGQANGNRGGMIGGAARRLRVDALKPPRLANPVRRRTSRSLAPDCLRLRSRRGTRGANPVRSVLALNKALHQSPRSSSSKIIADSSFSQSLRPFATLKLGYQVLDLDH